MSDAMLQLLKLGVLGVLVGWWFGRIVGALSSIADSLKKIAECADPIQEDEASAFHICNHREGEL